MNKQSGFGVMGVELPEAIGDVISPEMFIDDQTVEFREGDILTFGGFHETARGLIISAERPDEGTFAQRTDGSCRAFLVPIIVELSEEHLQLIFTSIVTIIAYSSGLALEVLEATNHGGPKVTPTKLKLIKKP